MYDIVAFPEECTYCGSMQMFGTVFGCGVYLCIKLLLFRQTYYQLHWTSIPSATIWDPSNSNLEYRAYLKCLEIRRESLPRK